MELFEAKFHIDVLEKYDDAYESEYLALHQESWRSATIDAITVHIKGKSEVNVMLPVAALLLYPR